MEDMMRPRLYGDTKKWELIIDAIKQIGLTKAEELLFSNGGTQFNSKDGTLSSVSRNVRVKNEKELIEVAKIDSDEWEVTNWLANTWEQHSKESGYQTLFQVKAWLKRRGLAHPDDRWTEKWLETFITKLKKVPKLDYPAITPQRGEETIILADLHVGAVMKDSQLIPDYNVSVLEGFLDKIAKDVNLSGKKVNVVILGDFIESFTGKNKKDTWKTIELHGVEAALTAFDLLYHFFTKIYNLNGVYFVSGNHDRITDDNESDPYGQVGKLLYGMFKRMSSIDIHYDQLVLNPDIDGIRYILTHGNYLIKKNNGADLVVDYGDQNKFNLIIGAHLHSRIVRSDKLKYRDITAPSLITGTGYEERNNWNSLAGYLRIENNGEGKPIITDVPL